MKQPDDATLRQARDLGAATYMTSYLHLMMRELGVDDSDNVAVNAMAAEMVEAMNLATETTFRALMKDHEGVEKTLEKFRICLANL